MFLMFLSCMAPAELILPYNCNSARCQGMWNVHCSSVLSLYIPHTPIFWCLIKDDAKWCVTCTCELLGTVGGSQVCFFGYDWDHNLIKMSHVCSKVTGCSFNNYVICLQSASRRTRIHSERTTVKALFIHCKHFCDCFPECTHLLFSYQCATHKLLIGSSSSVSFCTPLVPLNQ